MFNALPEESKQAVIARIQEEQSGKEKVEWGPMREVLMAFSCPSNKLYFYFMPSFMGFLSLSSGMSLRENLKQCVCCSD
jgi:hypothetical protein